MIPNVSFYSPGTLPWIWNFFLFFLAVFWSFTVPGSSVVRIFRLSRLKHVVLSTIVGMVLWAWQGILVGYLHHRELTWIYLGLGISYWILTRQYRLLPRWVDIQPLFKLKFFFFLGIFGIFFQQIPLFMNGFVTRNGVLFCCASDTFWYLSLADLLVRHFPPETPGLSGVILKNYHYFFLITASELIRIFHLPIMPTIFQYVRILYGILYAAIGYLMIAQLTPHKLTRKLFFFFLFFSADLLYLVGFLASGKLDFYYNAIYISQKMMQNMPMTVATILLYTVLFLLTNRNKQTWATGFVIAFLIGSSIGFKTYVGIILLFGMGVVSVIDVFRRKSFVSFFIFVVASCVAAAAFLPVSKGAGGLYPGWFWRIELLMTEPVLHFPQKTLEWVSYWTKQKRLFHAPLTTMLPVLGYEFVFSIYFLISLFGTTLLGFLPLKKTGHLSRSYYVVILSMIIFSLILGMFFLQTTGGGHTYNFLIVAYLLLMILTALVLGTWFAKHKQIAVFGICVVIFLNALPTAATVVLFTNQIVRNELFLYSWDELAAAAFLAKQDIGDGYVFIHPDNKLDYVTPYISAFAKQPLYMSGPYIVSALNLPYQQRLANANVIVKSNNPDEITKVVEKERIRFIYVTKKEHFDPVRGEKRLFLPVFENQAVTIYTPRIP